MSDDEGADIIELDRSRPSFGDWATEEEAAAEFDRRIEASGLWTFADSSRPGVGRAFREVTGFYLAYRPNREQKNARIDRILLPGKTLQDRGWKRVIGVEIKRSGEKLGKPLAQAMDYTYCAWNVGVYWMLCENVFLWPFPKQFRSLESVMVHNACGVIFDSPSAPLIFQLERQVIRINSNGSWVCSESTAGRKVGSR